MSVNFYTKTLLKRGKQIDKVYDYWCRAYDAFGQSGVTLDTSSATRWLKRLRNYLNKEFPDDRRKSNS